MQKIAYDNKMNEKVLELIEYEVLNLDSERYNELLKLIEEDLKYVNKDMKIPGDYDYSIFINYFIKNLSQYTDDRDLFYNHFINLHTVNAAVKRANDYYDIRMRTLIDKFKYNYENLQLIEMINPFFISNEENITFVKNSHDETMTLVEGHKKLQFFITVIKATYIVLEEMADNTRDMAEKDEIIEFMHIIEEKYFDNNKLLFLFDYCYSENEMSLKPLFTKETTVTEEMEKLIEYNIFVDCKRTIENIVKNTLDFNFFYATLHDTHQFKIFTI